MNDEKESSSDEVTFNEDRSSASGFACSCKPESEVKLQALREWAYKELGSDRYPVTAENFLTNIIYTLANRYHAWIESLPSDMWGAVTTKSGYPNDEQFHTYIQCDKFEDGLAVTLKAYVEKFPNGREDDGELQEEKA